MRNVVIENNLIKSIIGVMRNRLLVLHDYYPKNARVNSLIVPGHIVRDGEKVVTGTVISVGSDIVSVKPGDRVLKLKCMGTSVKIDAAEGMDLRHIDESQMLATLSGRECDEDYDFFSEGLLLD